MNPHTYPCISPKPHSSPRESILNTLDARLALTFYLGRTKETRKSDTLFICFSHPHKGTAIFAQRISKWIASCIYTAYQLPGKEPLQTIRTYSTHAIAISVAFLHNVPLVDSCRAATRSSHHTFAQYYGLQKGPIPTITLVDAVLASSHNGSNTHHHMAGTAT